MRKIVFAALLATVASTPVFAMEDDQGSRMEQGRKEMRALEDKHMQERRTVEDECHDKMKAMHDRHQKEREEIKSKLGMGKGGKEGREGGEGRKGREGGEGRGSREGRDR